MSRPDIEAIRARAEAAAECCYTPFDASERREQAQAVARHDIPALLAYIAELEARLR